MDGLNGLMQAGLTSTSKQGTEDAMNKQTDDIIYCNVTLEL